MDTSQGKFYAFGSLWSTPYGIGSAAGMVGVATSAHGEIGARLCRRCPITGHDGAKRGRDRTNILDYCLTPILLFDAVLLKAASRSLRRRATIALSASDAFQPSIMPAPWSN